MVEKKSFTQLSLTQRQRLIELRAQGSTLKAVPNPVIEATAFFLRKKPKRMRQWNNLRYLMMKRIDKNRVRLGLKPIHFQ